MGNVTLTGMDEMIARLSGVSFKLANGAIKAGLRQGANLIRDQAKANFNTGDGPSDLSGVLKDSIRTVSRRGTPTRIVFSVVAGRLTTGQMKKFGANAAYYALWVEKGHINRGLGQALRGGRSAVREARAASTSNTPAYPYMLPAIESKAQEAIDVLAQVVAEKLPEALT